MGLLFSALLSYAGAIEAIECVKFIMAGMLPETEPDFRDLVEYYRRLLDQNSKLEHANNWTHQGGQGYLSLVQNEDGCIKSAAVKYYDEPHSTAILFSTKISSFGQESIENSSSSCDNGSTNKERYIPSTTKTLITNTSESISIGQNLRRSLTPSYDQIETVSDPPLFLENSSVHSQDERKSEDRSDSKEKLTWRYRPLSPAPQTLPEIHFQSFETDRTGEPAYSEDYLRSLDGIKYRPLQRTDPSGRRRSFKKRHSSSSTSSRESRASREEELKMFTSLEEAEFEVVSKDDQQTIASSPNLVARSYSRSRSRESSKERRQHSSSQEEPAETAVEETEIAEQKSPLKELPKLGSFEEETTEHDEEKEEVINEEVEEEEVDDFWGNSGD